MTPDLGISDFDAVRSRVRAPVSSPAEEMLEANNLWSVIHVSDRLHNAFLRTLS